MEVCFLASGETVTVLAAAQFEGQTAKVVKQNLAKQLGVTRFRQRLFVDDASRELPDDEVFALAPLRVQLLIAEFWPATEDETERMIASCRLNRVAELEKYLKAPRNPNVTGQHGLTALHHAAGCGSLVPMRLLLEAQAALDVKGVGLHGMTPLHLAAGGGYLEAVRLLVEAGADKNATDSTGATALCSAAQEGRLGVVRYLLEVGAAKDQAIDAGATPLFMAAQEGHLEVVRILLEAGANQDQPRRDGATALSIANQEGHQEVVCFLLEQANALPA